MIPFAFLGFAGGIFINQKPHPSVSLISPIANSTGLISTSVLGMSTTAKTVLPSNVNVLFLGLDARRGDTRPRCDSIHLFQLNLSLPHLLITTIPRGTVVNGKGLPEGGTYIGNVCHYQGIAAIRDKVKEITGIAPDYYVSIGFSQTLGIFRTVGLPTTSTLRFLRTRATSLGDHQRSYNQAVFLRDFILTNTKHIAKIPKPVRYFFYQLVNTDMDYETAHNFFEAFLDSQLSDKPDTIELATKPDLGRPVKDRHYSNEVTSAFDQKGSQEEFLTYQRDVETYLANISSRANAQVLAKRLNTAFELIKTPFSQRIWLQLEDEAKREKYHWEFLQIYVSSHPDRGEANTILLDYISEMENFGYTEYKNKGDQLLSSLSS